MGDQNYSDDDYRRLHNIYARQGDRIEALEADLTRIRSETIEECAAVAERLECPHIGRAIRDLTKAEETVR